MNIFLRELRMLRKSSIVWLLSLIGVAGFFIAMFPGINADAAGFEKMLAAYPEAARKAFSLTIASIVSPLGYYTFVFGYIALCGAIQAMNWGLNVLAKETRGKTADFIFTKPVRRGVIFAAKAGSVLTALVLSDAIYTAAAAAMLRLAVKSGFDTKKFLLVSLTLLFIQLVFFAVGLMLAAVLPKIRSVLTLSMGTVFSFYIFAMLMRTSGGDVWRYFTPFEYFRTDYILAHAAYETPFAVTAALLTVFAAAAGCIVYIKKDIHAV